MTLCVSEEFRRGESHGENAITTFHHASSSTTSSSPPSSSRSSREETSRGTSPLTFHEPQNSMAVVTGSQKLVESNGTHVSQHTNGLKATNGPDSASKLQTSNSGHGLNNHDESTYSHPEPELCKITPSSIYLTFNAPRVDEYHRAILLTNELTTCLPTPLVSGNLYHATYLREPTPPEWILESRPVNDLSSSKSLVLLYRIAHYVDQDMVEVTRSIEDVLRSVPLGKEARTKEIGPCVGHPALGGYDCIIWTADALEALVKAKLLNLGDKTAAQVVSETRALAGPPDARTMVGVQHEFRVINQDFPIHL